MPDFGDDRVMACTAADMQRWLRDYTGQADLVVGESGRLSFTDRGVDMTVMIDPMPVRRIHLMKFYDSRVRFSYPPEQAAAARQWVHGFDRHTQRGGG